MIWVIEFRNGIYLQLHTQEGGPLNTAMWFNSEDEANGFIEKREWVSVNGGMPKLLRASRHLDLELCARVILRTMPPGSLSAPPAAVTQLQEKLRDLAQAIWTQGWDCREEQGPLAGAFGHANRYNPYRSTPTRSKCRGCGISPLRTERGRCEDCGDCQGCGDEDCPSCHDEIIARTIKGSERFPADADAVFQVFPEKGFTREDVVISIEKMRDDPIPTLDGQIEYRCGICSKLYGGCDCAATGRR